MRLSWLLFFICTAYLTAQDQKVVVIGFDGADFRLVNSMLVDGELPNLQQLKQQGDFKPLLPTNPPQTPVSWSTFATGLNPGRTGIFDFLKRKEGAYIMDFALRGETVEPVLFGDKNVTYLPALGFATTFVIFLLILFRTKPAVRFGVPFVLAGGVAYGLFFVAANWLPTTIPGVETVRQGKPIWEILREQDRTASVIRLPVTFPAEPLNGQMISGLAVPDMRGTVGKPSLFTNDPSFDPGGNKFSVQFEALQGEAPYQSKIIGPPNKLFYNADDELQAKRNGEPYTIPKDFDIPLEIATRGDKLLLNFDDQTLEIGVGAWSDWVIFNYRVNPLITLKGFGRFYLEYFDKGIFKLYLTPIHPHPETPLPISYPADLAQKIWEREPYKTMGWALDTWTTGDGMMNEDHLIRDIDMTVTRYETMMEEFLVDNDRDLFIQIFSFTDRLGHILWRHWDAGHPRHEPENAEKYQNALKDAYRRMDAIVGKAMAMVDLDKTLFMVVSDHGFSSFRYQFNYNTWLVENGYMVLKKNVLGQTMVLEDLQTNNTPLSFVDWSKTKAYAYGLGMVFINLEGREPEGSVKAEEYDALVAELREKLEAYVDPETGQNPVAKVYLRDDIYSGYDSDVTPDLRVSTALDWRVSWDTTLGGMPAKIAEINERNWSGDHCSLDPYDVQGILFSSRPVKGDNPKMADMTPTMLDFLGVDPGINMDGESVLEK